jgi:hypothetical protein
MSEGLQLGTADQTTCSMSPLALRAVDTKEQIIFPLVLCGFGNYMQVPLFLSSVLVITAVLCHLI